MLKLRDGDYVPDGKGGLETVEGTEELLERVLWKLTVRRGSFPFLPTLGSRLHLLGRAAPKGRPALARQYVAEALADEAVTVTDVALEPIQGGAALTVRMDREGEELTARVEIGGAV